MSEFAKFKIGIALALLGVLFTLQPLVKELEGVAVVVLRLQLRLVWFFYATSALLGLSVGPAEVAPAEVECQHCFTLDVLQDRGASGSPVFFEHDPEVIGMLDMGYPNFNIASAIPSYERGRGSDYLDSPPLPAAFPL